MSPSSVYAHALAHFYRVLGQAKRCARIRDATAMLLATATRRGQPSLRAVLLKGVDERGFVFYTNLESRKGRELISNPRAALTFLWHPIRQQVHIEGRIVPVTEQEADAYWVTRPRDSQIGAWASRQSEALSSRKALVAKFRYYQRKFRGKSVPRPAAWSGLRVVPDRIEFWKEGSFRLHHRLLFKRGEGRWVRQLLYP